MNKLSIFLAIAISSGAQAQQVDCAKFSAAIEHDMKMMSISDASGPKEQLNNGFTAAAAATNIQSNLVLMQAAKCKLPTDPITPLYYSQAAFDCSTKERFNAPDRDKACDTTKWERKKQ
jgi:hypothetical protein